MGISPQLTQDFNSTKNDKDLIETQNVQDFNSNKKISKFPDYAKSFKKEYIFLLGINESFSYLYKDLYFYDVQRGSLKKRSGWIDKINIQIKKYKEGIDSGILKDLSEEELNYEVFLNIEDIEITINEYLDIYLDFNPIALSKIDLKKYENNVDKDYPGLRKLIDTLSYYYENIKYKKIYIFPESEKGGIIDYEDSNSDSDSDSDRDDYYSKEELKQFLYFKSGLDSDIGSDSDSDSD